jgi:sulfatase maturation enzyme AslB (radical SAM superfamily)
MLGIQQFSIAVFSLSSCTAFEIVSSRYFMRCNHDIFHCQDYVVYTLLERIITFLILYLNII